MFQLGSISSGTLRTEDLQESFAHAIKRLTEAPHYEQLAWLAIEDGSLDMVDELQEALNELCPPFVYFGAHPGDGSDFGFWPDMDSLNEAMANADGECSNSNCEHLLTNDGVIVQVSDHGNVTVMDMERNVLWSVV